MVSCLMMVERLSTRVDLATLRRIVEVGMLALRRACFKRLISLGVSSRCDDTPIVI